MATSGMAPIATSRTWRVNAISSGLAGSSSEFGGSDFYRDREKAMEPVWSELDRLGIRPGGVDDSAAAPPPPKSIGSQRRMEDDLNEPIAGPPPSELVKAVPTVTRIPKASPTPTHITDLTPATRKPMVEPQEETESIFRPENRSPPTTRDPVTPVLDRAEPLYCVRRTSRSGPAALHTRPGCRGALPNHRYRRSDASQASLQSLSAREWHRPNGSSTQACHEQGASARHSKRSSRQGGRVGHRWPSQLDRAHQG